MSSEDQRSGSPPAVGLLFDAAGGTHGKSDQDEALVDLLFDGAPIGLALLDRELRYVRVNSLLSEINGRLATEHVGRRPWEMFPAMPGWIEEEMRRVIDTGVAKLNVELPGETQAAPGTLRSFVNDWYPMRARGAVIGLGAIVHEVTGQRSAEKSLRESEARATARAAELQAALLFAGDAERAILASREQLRALLARVNSIREDEKARIATDLHDRAGQVLTALRLHVEALEEGLGHLPRSGVIAALVERAVHASELVANVIETMDHLVFSLRPVALDRLGLAAALRQECRWFEEWAGVACVVATPEDPPPLSSEVEIALFRITQEALTNVARHANASRVVVSLAAPPGAVVLRIEDDGSGISEAAGAAQGLGVVGMRERAERVGGELRLEAHDPRGTVVVVRIPQGDGGAGEEVA